jgi:hypothetical protein
MTLKDLVDLAGERDLAKSYPKTDGVYIWDYKLTKDRISQEVVLELIPSNSGKAGFQDKVSVEELINYVLEETPIQTENRDTYISQMKITGVEDITIAKI